MTQKTFKDVFRLINIISIITTSQCDLKPKFVLYNDFFAAVTCWKKIKYIFNIDCILLFPCMFWEARHCYWWKCSKAKHVHLVVLECVHIYRFLVSKCVRVCGHIFGCVWERGTCMSARKGFFLFFFMLCFSCTYSSASRSVCKCGWLVFLKCQSSLRHVLCTMSHSVLCYINHSRQFDSSDPSPQSLSPSQRHIFIAHRPLLHRNSLGSQGSGLPDEIARIITSSCDWNRNT